MKPGQTSLPPSEDFPLHSNVRVWVLHRPPYEWGIVFTRYASPGDGFVHVDTIADRRIWREWWRVA